MRLLTSSHSPRLAPASASSLQKTQRTTSHKAPITFPLDPSATETQPSHLAIFCPFPQAQKSPVANTYHTKRTLYPARKPCLAGELKERQYKRKGIKKEITFP